MKTRLFGGFACALAMSVLLAAGAHGATTVYVNGACGSNAWTGASPVCTAPDGPKATIQAGITAAVNGDEVVVADGVYTGAGNKNLDFGGRLITLRSATGPENCIIDCQGSGRGFYFHSGETTDAVVDGFTITGGNANGSCCVADRGGGMYLSLSSPTVVRCKLIANRASNVAGAVWVSHSSAAFIDCAFDSNVVSPGNAGAAIHNVFGSHLTLINCVFQHNTLGTASTGGGAIFVGGNPLSYEASTVSATGCVFVGNNASSGGAILNNGYAMLSNCLFVGNEALGQGYGNKSGKGGAIANFGELVITNSTIFANIAVAMGGGLYAGNETPNTNLDSVIAVHNCILWGNAGSGGTEDAQIGVADDDVTVNYSCVEGLTGQLGGIGNIGNNPLFVDPIGPDGQSGTTDDNLRLMAGSPCIDAGDNSAVPPDLCRDLDGNHRFCDDPDTSDTGFGKAPIVDMGAYEFALGTDPADLDCDGIVGMVDLAMLLESWGLCDGCCVADLDGDAKVGILDLLTLLANWG